MHSQFRMLEAVRKIDDQIFEFGHPFVRALEPARSLDADALPSEDSAITSVPIQSPHSLAFSTLTS